MIKEIATAGEINDEEYISNTLKSGSASLQEGREGNFGHGSKFELTKQPPQEEIRIREYEFKE